MSLFLGKIHYWLYNKILWAEELESDMLRLAEVKGLPIEEWTNEIHRKYGKPTEGKDLETIIDTSNIHGWLQGKIASVELRQAYLVTQILKANAELKQDLLKLSKEQGELAATKYEGTIQEPEDIFNALNDFVVEGMPCDHVNQINITNPQEFEWITTTCLHQPYWNEVEGNVEVFYELREAWVKAFVSKISDGYTYTRNGFTHRIVK